MEEVFLARSRIYRKKMDINREGENGTIKRQEIEGKEKEMMHGTKAWGNILQVCQDNST